MNTEGGITIGKYRLEGGGMFPEQYDVFDGGKQVAYLRLRHGRFRAHVPDAAGEIVYEAHVEGGVGGFEDEERERYLTAAIAAVDEKLKGMVGDSDPEAD